MVSLMDRIAKVGITDISSGVRRLVAEHEAHSDKFSEYIVSTLKTGKGKSFEIDGRKYMFVAYNPTIRILCMGISEITGVLQKFCDIMGYYFAYVPHTDVSTAEIDRYTAVCCFAHQPDHDDPMLEVALKTNCFYIGAIGAVGYHEQRKERLRGRGFTEEEISRIHSPIGINIGSKGSQEIALSVISEIVKEFHSRSILNVSETN
jgi:xanthine dehydrogenase accessory factor